VLTRFAHFIATGFGIGYAPKAPGTFGSLPGIPLGILLARTTAIRPIYGVALWTGVIAVGLWSVIIFEHQENVHDDKRIVVDEILGQSLAFSLLAFAAPSVLFWEPLELTLLSLAAFTLFRILDIWKPGPIGWIDRQLHSPLGTCLDDLLAGLMASIVLTAVLFIL
jgi:phosphatidylglycerophosphatase A